MVRGKNSMQRSVTWCYAALNSIAEKGMVKYSHFNDGFNGFTDKTMTNI